jgi:hypothetical protein
MPTKDIKQKTTKRRSTSKSTENKRKVHRKSSTQLKKGGVIGQLYNPNKNQYEANRYRHYDPKFVFDQNQNRYDLDNIDYSVPYGFQYTRPKLDIPSKIDVPYDHDKKWENNNNAYESDSVGVRKYPIVKPKIGNEMQKRIDKYLASADEIDENEYPRKRLADVGRQDAMRFGDNYPILEKKEVPKKHVSDSIANLMAKFNNGGRKVTKKQVVHKKKVTKKPADAKKKVTKKQVVPKKKVTKKPADPKKKVTKKPVVPKKKVTKK